MAKRMGRKSKGRGKTSTRKSSKDTSMKDDDRGMSDTE